MLGWKCPRTAPRLVDRASPCGRSTALFLGVVAAHCNIYDDSLLSRPSRHGREAGVTDASSWDSSRGSGGAEEPGERAGTTGRETAEAGIGGTTAAGGALGGGDTGGDTGVASTAGGAFGAGGSGGAGGSVPAGGAFGAGGAATGGAEGDAASTGSAGGATGGADASGGGGTCASGTVRVEYKPQDTSTLIHYEIHVYGVGSVPIPLNRVEIRYYFTQESPTVAQTVRTSVSELQNPFQSGIAEETAIRTLSPSATDADHYLEIRPDKGGNATLNKDQYYSNKGYFPVSNQIQTNDYSFGTQTTFVNWKKIAVWVDGVQQWGCTP